MVAAALLLLAGFTRAEEVAVELSHGGKVFSSKSVAGGTLDNIADCPGAPGILRYAVKEAARTRDGLKVMFFIAYFGESSEKEPEWVFIRRYMVPFDKPLKDDIPYGLGVSLTAKE